MNSDNSKRKFVLLVAVAITIAILAFIYAYTQIFGGSDTVVPNEQYANFPESSVSEMSGTGLVDDVNGSLTNPDPLPVDITDNASDTGVAEQSITSQVETDWKDEVVQFTSSDSPSQPKTTTVVNTATDVDSNIEALYAAAEEFSSYTPQYPDGWPLPTSSSPGTMSFEEFSSFFAVPKIDQSNLTDCGTVNVPSSESALNKFMSNLENNDSAVCMGEAIANDCATAKVTITEDDLSQIHYVAQRADGVCGIAMSYGGKYINLCNIKDVMNAVNNKNDDYSEWQSLFATNPGETFASLYLGSDNLDQAPIIENLDCKSSEL